MLMCRLNHDGTLMLGGASSRSYGVSKNLVYHEKQLIYTVTMQMQSLL
jgi:hypothetical protein